MESNRTQYYLSVFLFSVLTLVFLSWGCGKKESEKEKSAEIQGPGTVDTTKDKDKAETRDIGKEEQESIVAKAEKKQEEAKTRYDDRTGITWVEIKGGDFRMGSEKGGTSERPVRRVNIKTFLMAKTQVTVAQYRKCVEAGRCKTPRTGGKYDNWDFSERYKHPVNGVDWDQARTYCEWAGGRLPSEAEWEYAARSGGRNINYPWGNETATCYYAVMNDGGDGCGTDRTWPVCSKPAGNTDQGLCDMAGNVWEWLEDDWHDSYNGAPDDGSAWVDEPRGSYRVKRGGSFGYTAVELRAADRYYVYPSFYYGHFGVRCARDAP